MLEQTLINWQEFEVQVSPEGDVNLRFFDKLVVSGLGIKFPSPWHRVSTSFSVDQVTSLWTCGQTQAVVDQIFDQSWLVRIRIVNESPGVVTVPGCWLEYEPAYPDIRLLAGVNGLIGMKIVGANGLIGLTSSIGFCHQVGERVWLSETEIVLAGKHNKKSSRRIIWRGETYDSVQLLYSCLPSWWPENTVLEVGEELSLQLPDAGISGTDIKIVSAGDQQIICGEPGEHVVNVHHSHGTSLLPVWFSSPEQQILTEVANRLSNQDPRSFTPSQAMILWRANRIMLVGQDDSMQKLGEVIEELCAKPVLKSVIGVAVIAEYATDCGDTDLFQQAVEHFLGLDLQAGLGFCGLTLAMGAKKLDFALDMSWLENKIFSNLSPGQCSPVEADLIKLERTLLTSQAPIEKELLDRLGWLAQTNDRKTLTKLSNSFFAQRFPLTVQENIRDQRRKLFASQLTGEELAWLIW